MSFRLRGRRGAGLFLALLALPSLYGCGARGASPPTPGVPLLPLDPIEAIPSTPPLDGVLWGILFVDVQSGAVLHARNAGRRFIPASNRKLAAMGAALELLGPDFQWTTGFHGGALPDGQGRVQGDLVVPGTGDPTLGPPFHASGSEALQALAQALAAAGVRSVTGALVVDASGWDSTSVPGSWMVGNLASVSGASGGAFTVGAGILEVEVVGGNVPGDPARIAWTPRGDSAFVDSRIRTVHPDSATEPLRPIHLPESRRVRLEGSIGVGERRILRTPMREAVLESARALHRALGEAGIEVAGGVRVAWDDTDPAVARCRGGAPRAPSSTPLSPPAPCPALPRLAGLPSPPLAEVAAAVLGPSQNWMSEQVVRTLGSRLGERGSWSEGLRLEREWMIRTVGVDSLDFVLRDGSGLSVQNLVTPRAVVQLLLHMARGPHGDLYRQALPAPGERGGTLSGRLPGLEDRVRAKTGSLTHVNALSGYLRGDSGRLVAFSILTNGSGLPANTVREAIDRMVEVAVRRW